MLSKVEVSTSLNGLTATRIATSEIVGKSRQLDSRNYDSR